MIQKSIVFKINILINLTDLPKNKISYINITSQQVFKLILKNIEPNLHYKDL